MPAASWSPGVYADDFKLARPATFEGICSAGWSLSALQVWDMDIGDCILQLRPPQAPTGLSPLGTPLAAPAPQPLTCLAVTPDGSCCLSGDVDGYLSCWNLGTGALLQRIRAHNGRCAWHTQLSFK